MREPSNARRAIPQMGRITKKPTINNATCVINCRKKVILRIGHSFACFTPAIEERNKDHQDNHCEDIEHSRDGKLTTSYIAIAAVGIEDVIGECCQCSIL